MASENFAGQKHVLCEGCNDHCGLMVEYRNRSRTLILGHWLGQRDIKHRSRAFVELAPPVAASPEPMHAEASTANRIAAVSNRAFTHSILSG